MTKSARKASQHESDDTPESSTSHASLSGGVLPLIPIDTYWPANDESYEGNILITAWPHLSDEVLADMLNHTLEYSSADRKAPVWKKRELVAKLSEFFLPLDNQLHLAMRLWAFINQGYAARSPCKAKTAADRFGAMVNGIAKGKIDHKRKRPYSTTARVMTVIGIAGSGKSTTFKNFLQEMSQGGLLHHWQHGEVFQLPSLSFTLTEGSNRYSIVRSIYRELMVAAKSTGLPVIYSGSKPRTFDDFEDAIRILVRKLHVGVLILDEVQWLFGGTKKKDDSAMQFLTSLSEALGVPLLVIGTWKCLSHLSSEMCLGRRAAGPDSGRFYRLARGEEWDVFLGALWRYQYTTEDFPLTDDLSALFYDLTQGIQDLTVKLYRAVQLRCIEDDAPMTPHLVCKEAHTLFATVQVDLQRLREGTAEESVELTPKTKEESDRAIAWSLSLIAHYAAQQLAGTAPVSPTTKVAESLSAALPAAPASAAGNPGADPVSPPSASASTANSKVIKLRPPRAQNKATAATDSAFAALPDDDLRKLAYLAWKAKRPMIDDLVKDSFHWSFTDEPDWIVAEA